MALRVVLADDHPIVLEGLRLLLERGGIEVAAVAADGREAVHLAMTSDSDVVVLDLFMPRLNGLDAASEILQKRPDAAILLLSMASEPHHVVAARSAGVRGYVVKTQAAEELIVAIQTVAAGEPYLSDTLHHVFPSVRA
jgi:DNA-binding NarL/FixJ family response regulator